MTEKITKFYSDLDEMARRHYRGPSFENAPKSERVPGFAALWRIIEFYNEWQYSHANMALALEEFGTKPSDGLARPNLVRDIAESLLYESGREDNYNVTSSDMLHSDNQAHMLEILFSGRYFYSDIGGIRVPAIEEPDRVVISSFLTKDETIKGIFATPVAGLLWVETTLNPKPEGFVKFGSCTNSMHRLVRLGRRFPGGISSYEFLYNLSELFQGKRSRVRLYEPGNRSNLGLSMMDQRPDVQYRIQVIDLRLNNETLISENNTVAYPREVSALAKLPNNKVLVLFREYYQRQYGSDAMYPIPILKPRINYHDLVIVEAEKWNNYLEIMNIPGYIPSREQSIVPSEFDMLDGGVARMFPTAF